MQITWHAYGYALQATETIMELREGITEDVTGNDCQENLICKDTYTANNKHFAIASSYICKLAIHESLLLSSFTSLWLTFIVYFIVYAFNS